MFLIFNIIFDIKKKEFNIIEICLTRIFILWKSGFLISFSRTINTEVKLEYSLGKN